MKLVKIKNTLIIITSLLLLLNVFSVVNAMSFPWIDKENKDMQLLKALNDGNLSRFETLLKKGANPNKIFGEKWFDWVMCSATERGKIPFLKLAIQYGGDINLRNRIKPVQTITSAPILCAITNHNMQAFDFLLMQGVDLSIHAFEDAQPISNEFLGDPILKGKTLYGSPLTRTLAPNEYCMTLKIIEQKELNWEELISIKRSVEFSMVDPNSERDKCRWKIIELLRQQGQDIDPEKALKAHQEKRMKWQNMGHP